MIVLPETRSGAPGLKLPSAPRMVWQSAYGKLAMHRLGCRNIFPGRVLHRRPFLVPCHIAPEDPNQIARVPGLLQRGADLVPGTLVSTGGPLPEGSQVPDGRRG